MAQNTLFRFLSGLGLFLYGLKLLSGSLTAFAGARLLRRQPATGTSGAPALSFYGFVQCALFGAVITAALQSSGAVTVFAVGAAGAGLLPVAYAVALCWGANLGTTATGQLLRLAALSRPGTPIVCCLCCFLGGVGALVLPKRFHPAAEGIFGLGLTFTGLLSLGEGMAPFLRSETFIRLCRLPAPAACLAGILLSAGMQSSSGAVGLVQAVAAGGVLYWRTAVPLVLGINIGTCSTAFLAALAAQNRKPAAIWVAAGHMGFNLCGCVAAGLVSLALQGAAFWGKAASFSGIANFHTGFNAATLALLVGAAGLFFRRSRHTAQSAAFLSRLYTSGNKSVER